MYYSFSSNFTLHSNYIELNYPRSIADATQSRGMVENNYDIYKRELKKVGVVETTITITITSTITSLIIIIITYLLLPLQLLYHNYSGFPMIIIFTRDLLFSSEIIGLSKDTLELKPTV